MSEIRVSPRFWDLLSIVAIVVMVSAAAFDLLAPKPKDLHTLKDRQGQEQKLDKDVSATQAALTRAQNQVSLQVWKMPADKVGARALANVTALAQKHSLQLVAFRPQRTIDQDGLQLLPYTIVLDGSFASMFKFLREIEAPESKLAVSLVQVASTDAANDSVNATIGVIAYTVPSESTDAKA